MAGTPSVLGMSGLLRLARKTGAVLMIPFGTISSYGLQDPLRFGEVLLKAIWVKRSHPKRSAGAKLWGVLNSEQTPTFGVQA